MAEELGKASGQETIDLALHCRPPSTRRRLIARCICVIHSGLDDLLSNYISAVCQTAGFDHPAYTDDRN